MLKNLKIGKKLILCFAVLIVLFILIVSVGLICLKNVSSTTKKMHDGPYVVSTEALGILYDINTIAKDLRSSIMTEDWKSYESVLKQSEQSLEERIDHLNRAEMNQTELLNTLKQQIEQLNTERAKIYTALETGDYEEAEALLLGDYVTIYNRFMENATQLYEQADAAATDFVNSAEGTFTWIMVAFIVAMVVIIVLATIIITVTVKGITNPLTACAQRLKLLAQGNLTEPVPVVDSNDEIGELAQATQIIVDGLGNLVDDLGALLVEMSEGNFDIHSNAKENYIGDFEPLLTSVTKINHNLSSTLSQINEAAEQVDGASDQVASGAQALSQGATEQASSVEQLAATITEISAQVKENAENAEKATARATAVGEEMTQSNQQVQEMIHAMGDIRNSSNEISKIIKTIEDIAFQTNILALNAAVEAARAGTAGKGFAVVADEVRNLANKSAEASKNTASLIESSIRAVEHGSEIADQAAQSMLSVVKGASEVTRTINVISDASNVQANSLEQVTMGIDQISSVVQTNSATSEESAAASEEMSSQAQMLKNLVGQFRLRSVDLKSAYFPTESQVVSVDSSYFYGEPDNKY